MTLIWWPGWRGLPVWEGWSESVGRAGPVGEPASQTPRLPHPGLQAVQRPGNCQAGRGRSNPHTVGAGAGQSCQLQTGAGLPPWAAAGLLPRGTCPAAAAAAQGHAGSGCAGETKVEELAGVVLIAPIQGRILTVSTTEYLSDQSHFLPCTCLFLVVFQMLPSVNFTTIV